MPGDADHGSQQRASVNGLQSRPELTHTHENSVPTTETTKIQQNRTRRSTQRRDQTRRSKIKNKSATHTHTLANEGRRPEVHNRLTNSCSRLHPLLKSALRTSTYPHQFGNVSYQSVATAVRKARTSAPQPPVQHTFRQKRPHHVGHQHLAATSSRWRDRQSPTEAVDIPPVAGNQRLQAHQASS